MFRLTPSFFVRTLTLICLLAFSPVSLSGQDVQPYDSKLNRVAEILGALTLLDQLCAEENQPRWRDYMAELIANNESNKDHMAQNFNEGFNGLKLSYKDCTPSARQLRRIYFDEALETVSDLITYYGY